MGVLDRFNPGTEASSSKSNVTGVNDIPAPRSDAAANTPPAQLHKRVVDFVNEAPAARYTFDSRARGDVPDCELCRVMPNGSKDCIRVAMNSKTLFKSMQQLSFYCALPAEPTRTHMECNRLPKMN